MKNPIPRRTVGTALGGIAALFLAGALVLPPAGAQAQTVVLVPDEKAVPDPAIAKGLAVFSDRGELVGTLEEVIQRDGRTFGILSVRNWPTEEPLIVEFPYESLTVSRGRLTYDVGRTLDDPIQRGELVDPIEWEPLDRRTDMEERAG